MIDTTNETRCKNPDCRKPIVHIPGHRRREYCNDTCKQTAYRLRKEQLRHGVTIVDDRQAQADQVNSAMYQQKLAACAARIEKLERQVEIQRQRLGQSYQSIEAKERIAELEQELTQYRQFADLANRAKMEAKFKNLGEQVQYRTLTTLNILGGSRYWHDFMKQANDEMLREAIAAAEYFLDGLIALRGDPREARIAALEKEVQELQKRLKVEERFRTDVEVRHFKSWLRKRQLPQDTDFFKRFLADTRLPQHASRAMYIARLKQYGYPAEDIVLFEETWKDMLFNQS